MATKRILVKECDVCGRSITPDADEKFVHVRISPTGRRGVTADLCQGCYAPLQEFVDKVRSRSGRRRTTSFSELPVVNLDPEPVGTPTTPPESPGNGPQRREKGGRGSLPTPAKSTRQKGGN